MGEQSIGPLDRNAKTYIAGHRGLVGSAIWRQFEKAGFSDLIGATHDELELTDRAAVFDFFDQHQPQTVILAAARVGGILANSTYPVEFLSENLQVQTSVLDAAVAQRTPRLLFLGSSCIYPKFAEQPIREDALLTGRSSRPMMRMRSPRSPASCTSRRPAASTDCRGSRDAHQSLWSR